MGWECSTHNNDERRVKVFIRKAERGKPNRTYRRAILQLVLRRKSLQEADWRSCLWRAFVGAVINLRIVQSAWNILTRLVTVEFSKRARYFYTALSLCSEQQHGRSPSFAITLNNIPPPTRRPISPPLP